MDVVTIIDTETTGIDHANDTCIEVAAVEYSIKEKSVLTCFSSVITTDASNEEAGKVNHIPQAILQENYARSAESVWRITNSVARRSSAILAHNSDFDLGWVPEGDPLRKLPWIDTCWMVTWPQQSRQGGRLIDLALEHGLGVVDPHRALSDCLLLARLMCRCSEMGHDVEALLARGLRPTAWVEALVSYDDRDLAKERGFKYLPILGREKDRKPKGWVKKMAIDDIETLPFSAKKVQV